MKIAIIGAGFFGSTIALKLSEQHTVHLYEKENNILNGASKANQFRFHMGFHYPRSQRTIKEIKSSYKLFLNFYSNRVFGKTKNYYAVSNKGSKTSYNKLIFIKIVNIVYEIFNIHITIIKSLVSNYRKQRYNRSNTYHFKKIAY